MTDQLISPEKMAERFDLSDEELASLLESGKLKVVWLGPIARISVDSIDAMLHTEPPNSTVQESDQKFIRSGRNCGVCDKPLFREVGRRGRPAQYCPEHRPRSHKTYRVVGQVPMDRTCRDCGTRGTVSGRYCRSCKNRRNRERRAERRATDPEFRAKSKERLRAFLERQEQEL